MVARLAISFSCLSRCRPVSPRGLRMATQSLYSCSKDEHASSPAMKPRLKSHSFAKRCRFALVGLVLFLFHPLLSANIAVAEELPTLTTLTNVEQIRRLTPEQAAMHYPLQVRGVVTFFDQSL